MRRLQNQRGFSAIELILILLALAIMGGAGFLIYKHGHKKPAATPAATTTTTKAAPVAAPAPAPTPDPTAAWTAYSSAPGSFSLRYPTTWVTAANATLCTDGLLLLGPTTTTVGHCASDSSGEILISSMAGDHQADYQLDENTKDVVKTAVTVSGVAGSKITATTVVPAGDVGIGPVAGTKMVNYVFFTGGKTYVLQYAQAPTYPDVLSDFTLLVTNTFKFTP